MPLPTVHSLPSHPMIHGRGTTAACNFFHFCNHSEDFPVFSPQGFLFPELFEGTRGFSQLVWFPSLSFSLLHNTCTEGFFYLSSSQSPSAHYKGLSLCISFTINGKSDSWNQARWLIEHDEAPYQHNQRAKRVYISYFFSILCVIDLRVLGSINNSFALLKIPKG